MSATLSDMATLVLTKLGHVPESQSASAHNDQLAKDAITSAHAELSEAGVCWWPLSETPESVKHSFANYAAADIAEVVAGEERAAFFISQRLASRRRIEAAASKRDISQMPTPAEYF